MAYPLSSKLFKSVLKQPLGALMIDVFFVCNVFIIQQLERMEIARETLHNQGSMEKINTPGSQRMPSSGCKRNRKCSPHNPNVY